MSSNRYCPFASEIIVRVTFAERTTTVHPGNGVPSDTTVPSTVASVSINSAAASMCAA
ncbi:MAG TPA: hypothetical protein VEK79_07185 [Thermoanaerobaculia bacterium]|nr:hypothetical protein [Thermoanaerobaculia bacterium]